MKKEFSKTWKSSKRPSKQRKYLAKAPIATKRKFLSANLSKPLRKIKMTRNVEIRKDDKVKVLRGKYKGKEGKVSKVLTKLLKIYISGIQTVKQDGSKVDVPFKASNLQIIELNETDKKRFKKMKEQNKSTNTKKEIKPVTIENKKSQEKKQ